jgi:hypothetical protein
MYYVCIMDSGEKGQSSLRSSLIELVYSKAEKLESGYFHNNEGNGVEHP